MPSIVSHATAADGTDLLVRHWPPDEVEAGGAWAGEPWASLLLVHGLSEQSGRYEHVGDQFAAAGLDAWAYDQRGNGGSGGRRGDVERWSQFHDDLAERLAAVRGQRGRPAGRALRPLDGRARRRRLPDERPSEARSRRPRIARPRLDDPGLEAPTRLDSWRASRRRSRSRTASSGRPCRAIRRSARRPRPIP